MSKVAIVYWSGTGNTAAMAAEVFAGAMGAGAEAELLECGAFNGSMMADYDAVAFGCPAMGAEVLEESEFQPMFDDCVPGLKGKKIALFGAYGWGDGEWMRDWESTCTSAGAVMAAEPVICMDPSEVSAELAALGAAIAG